MTDLLAIGTRKGLWLARSDDDRRTWTLDGPHLLAQEVAAVSIDTRRPAPRVLAGIQYGHWGPTVMWSDDLGRDVEGDRPRRDPLPRGHRGRAGPRLAAPARHRRPARRRLGRVRAALAVAQRRRGLHLRTRPRALRPPAPADLGARRRGRGGAHRPARPGVGPGDDRDEHRRRLRQRGRRREVGAAQQGHHRDLRARPAARVRAVRAQGRRRRGRSRPAVRAEPLRRLPHRRRGRVVVVDRRRAPGRLRVPDRRLTHARPARRGSCRWWPTCSGSRRTAGCACTAPGTPARRWTELGNGLPDDARGRRCCATRSAPTPADRTGIYVGTRDGCVYASADEGDTFTLVADHLPDVLTVKAATLP